MDCEKMQSVNRSFRISDRYSIISINHPTTSNYGLGLLFFINWFTDFFSENLGTEDEIKIKIKYNTST